MTGVEWGVLYRHMDYVNGPIPESEAREDVRFEPKVDVALMTRTLPGEWVEA